MEAIGGGRWGNVVGEGEWGSGGRNREDGRWGRVIVGRLGGGARGRIGSVGFVGGVGFRVRGVR